MNIPGSPSPWNAMLRSCPSRTSLARIANKWTAMIVISLGDGRLRFGQLREALDGISGKVLTETLRDLERDGIVSRHAYAEVPPRVEYELTELGATLFEPLGALIAWSESHIESVLEARARFDAERVT